jgi:hypothetical protein
MNLNQLKDYYHECLIATDKKVREIEAALGKELPAYRKMGTEIDLNGLSVVRGYEPFNDEDKQIIYKLKIKGLEYKLGHSCEFLMAIKYNNVEDMAICDLYREIGQKQKDVEV